MKTTIALAVLALAVGIPTKSDARPRPAEGTSSFEANKTFGLGLELGEPFGLNGKWFYSTSRAIDFGIGDIYDYYDYRGIYIYGDHLWHPVSLVNAAAFELPLYIGVGGSLWHWEDYRFAPHPDGNALGVRVPIGVTFDFNNTPLDIFIQIVPTVNIFADAPRDYMRDTVGFFVDGSVGIRYWFK
jgi:hypothetical protein